MPPRSPNRRQVLALTLAALGGPVGATEAGALAGSVLRFAEPDEARALLAAADDWMLRTGPWQRALLLHRRPPVDLASFQAWQAQAVLAWDDAGRERWQAALAAITPALQRVRLPWPAQMQLVRTDGRESDEQPHTRGTAIVLPRQFEQQGYSDGEVLAHELWHVLSRHRSALASRLYTLIGYEPVAELAWPRAWAEIRLVNQDAPFNRHAMPVTLAGRPTWLMPVTVVGEGDARQGLLDRLETRLIEVRPGRGVAPTRARQHAGRPVWHAVEAVPEFLERLGGNTDYTSHPDETLADNFMAWVSGRRVANPALLGRIETVLRESA